MIQVNVGKKKLVPGIGLNNNIIDQWSDVTRGVSGIFYIITADTCCAIIIKLLSLYMKYEAGNNGNILLTLLSRR